MPKRHRTLSQHLVARRDFVLVAAPLLFVSGFHSTIYVYRFLTDYLLTVGYE